jgi:mRNA-degrading endonuclease YafQ of YafQ-DinJ toxin-antitoxin module
LRSINVTWDYRIIFRKLSDNTYEIVELIKVWTHSELYK